MKTGFFYILILIFISGFVGCSPLKNSNYNEYLSMRSEADSCEKNYSYSKTTTLTGVAQYYKRGLNLVVQDGKLVNLALGDPISTPLPIRFAEVQVFDSTGQLVQCGKTDADGQIKSIDTVTNLKLPAISTEFTIRVLSRINYTLTFPGKPDFKVSLAVKKDKYTNELHSVEGKTTSNGSEDSSVVVTAYARQTESNEVTGGAFNILNAIYTAYDYIRMNTGSTNTTCLNPKLNVYWRAGFNPVQYYYPDADPSTLSSNSYYNPSEKYLYITGGKLGNITLERTDHFGDYVVIHEFGHHIENVCGSLLSPGGNHAILSRIDSRLAWAEGWSNFFAGQVMFNSTKNDGNYVLLPDFKDKMTAAGVANTGYTYLFASEGFSDSVQNIGNGSGFMMDLKKDGKNPDTWQTGAFFGMSFDKVDPNRYPGEGHFREGAISRGLFKLANNCGVTSGSTCIDSYGKPAVDFETLWNAMSKLSGMGDSYYQFKSSARFLELVKLQLESVTPGTWAANYKAFVEATTSDALHLFSDGAFSRDVVTDDNANSLASSGTPIVRWVPYGETLTSTVGPCAQGINFIEPRFDDPVLTATNSDQRYSNQFYMLDLNQLSGVDQIDVAFAKANPNGTDTEFDLLLFQQDYFFAQDYLCTSGDDVTTGTCSGGYVPSRTVTTDVIKSDRRAGISGSQFSKTIKGLKALDKTKKYLLNIRAYTPSKSISAVTDYAYQITTPNGATLCPVDTVQ